MSSWENEPRLSAEDKAELELSEFIEKARVHEGTMIIVASSIFNLMLDMQRGLKVEESLLRDFIKCALFMQHYADECGSLEFWMNVLDPTKRGHTMEALLNTLPLMRVAAGAKAAKWGDDLMKMIERVHDASR